MSESVWREVERELVELGSVRQREVLCRFFKTGKGEYGYGDRFLGVKVPETRAVVRKYARLCGFEDIRRLVRSPYHEIRLSGLLTLCCRYRLARACESERERIVAFYLDHLQWINNWDLVDLSCYELLGGWLLTHDRGVLYDLADPGRSLWENRVAIVTTMQFIRHGQFEDTFALADRLLRHPHDLIQKAVGWMLREVGKRDRPALEAFLQSRLPFLSRTTLRYAIERFPEDLRLRFLRAQAPDWRVE